MDDEFVPDVKAFERVAGGILGTKIDSRELKGKKFSDIARRLKSINLTPQEKLSEAVNAIAWNYKSDGVFSFSERDIDELLGKIHLLDNPKVTNPIGYILGYVATNGGKNMNNIESVMSKIKKGMIRDANVQPPDVIRYAKLWIRLQR